VLQVNEECLQCGPCLDANGQKERQKWLQTAFKTACIKY
jgi:disulfide oxidoreductase YuzD